MLTLDLTQARRLLAPLERREPCAAGLGCLRCTEVWEREQAEHAEQRDAYLRNYAAFLFDAVEERDALRAAVERLRAELELAEAASAKASARINVYPENIAMLDGSVDALRETLAMFDEVPHAR